jgi:dienelactone hydrolase
LAVAPAALPSVPPDDDSFGVPPELPGHAVFRFTSEGISHWVFHAGARHDPPVLVMQELPGLSPGLLLFSQRLADAGFQVYLPWLFGPLGQRSPLRNLARLCISREFAGLRSGVSAPVTRWLRSLATYVAHQNEVQAVAVIGMCVTGAFAIPLLLAPGVVAAVAAQPSVPLSLRYAVAGFGGSRRATSLNIGDAEIAAAAAKVARGEARLLGVRFRADRLCPPGKFSVLRCAFREGFELREYGGENDRNVLGHRPGPAPRRAFDDLLSFLRADAASPPEY